jgi:hypothetical protein
VVAGDFLQRKNLRVPTTPHIHKVLIKQFFLLHRVLRGQTDSRLLLFGVDLFLEIDPLLLLFLMLPGEEGHCMERA